MLKLTKIVFALLAAVFMLAGCQAEIPAVDVSPADVTAAVMDAIEFPSPVIKGLDSVGVYYTDLDISTIESMSVYVCGSGAYPDEITVFRFRDSASAAAGLEAATKRYDELVLTFTDYTPEEMYKLESPVLKRYGNYVVFIDCSDNEIAGEIVETYFK
jgi:hypothetical protein